MRVLKVLDMHLLRVVAQQSLLSGWLDQKPELPKLLKCFQVDRQASNPKPVSVYTVGGELEEMEAVAAVFQTASSSAEKRYGVLTTETECKLSGIRLDRHELGRTGIRSVDERHVNLCGNQAAFCSLMTAIVTSMWQGQQRLRSYPPQQIVGQLAVFSKLQGRDIHPESRKKCEEILVNANCHKFHESELRVEVRGALSDRKDMFEVVAFRSFGLGVQPVAAQYRSFWTWLLGLFKGE